jgi:hypothetical protein
MMGLVTGGLETKGELTAEVRGDDARCHSIPIRHIDHALGGVCEFVHLTATASAEYWRLSLQGGQKVKHSWSRYAYGRCDRNDSGPSTSKNVVSAHHQAIPAEPVEKGQI